MAKTVSLNTRPARLGDLKVCAINGRRVQVGRGSSVPYLGKDGRTRAREAWVYFDIKRRITELGRGVKSYLNVMHNHQ